jgi:hypothetical protein
MQTDSVDGGFHCHFLSLSLILGSHATRTPLTSPFLLRV